MELGGNPLVCASDVCSSLAIKNVGSALRSLDASERFSVAKANIATTDISFPNRGLVFITESGLYKLVLRSDKPEATDFQNWVTKVVLPAIRKDGGYIHGEEHVVSGAMSEDEPKLAPVEMFGRLWHTNCCGVP